jgi:UDPglucose--hexose-1-phosphate uridylyltransferase
MQNEIRKEYDTKDWTLLSEIEPSAVGCALCPGSEEKTEETYKIEDKKGHWTVRCIVDPYPLTHPSTFKLKEDKEFTQSFSAHGWSEIVIETRDHTKELHELTSEEIKNVLLAYSNRIKELRKREGVEYIGITKDNMHHEFDHAYSRIFTLPIVPRNAKEKQITFNDYWFKNEKCFYCDLIERERESSRLLLENESFVALVPYAPRNDFEIWILPKKHYTCISELNEYELFHLAEAIKNILTRLNAAISLLQYGIVFYNRPNKEKDFHFHVSIFQKKPKSTLQEGYDIFLAKISPENIAKILRGKK